jgi:hypothetical protein
VRVLLRFASKAPLFCSGELRADMSLCRFSAASGSASGSGGIRVRVPIWRAGLPAGSGSFPPLPRLVSRRAALVECECPQAVSDAYAEEGCCCCGVIVRTNACVRSRLLLGFVYADCGYYPPLR